MTKGKKESLRRADLSCSRRRKSKKTYEIRKEKERMNRIKNDEEKRIAKNGRIAMAAYTGSVLAMTLGTGMVFAAGDPIQVVNNLSEFIFSLIRAIGLILLGLGIMQVGLSLKSHDPSQRANGFLTLAGGIIITFTKEILTMITG